MYDAFLTSILDGDWFLLDNSQEFLVIDAIWPSDAQNVTKTEGNKD